jgi:hypothetical protein
VIRAVRIGCALLLLASFPVTAQNAAPAPSELEAGLAGQWTGTLGYRDYQSDQLFELPVRTEIRALADGVSVIRYSAFDDGPKTGTVWITTASLFNPATGSVQSVALRKGKPLDLSNERVTVTAYTDRTHWTLTFEEDGSDDDKPAKLRVTETRTGDTLLAVKEVRPLSGGDGKWQFRNQTKLVRSTAAP